MSNDALNTDALLRLLFEQSTEHALVLIDPGAKIVYWSVGAEKTFGYSADEALGQSVSILFTPENLAAGMDVYEQEVARTGIEAEDDRWMLRKDGVRFWATGVLSPIRDEGGRLIGFGKFVRDRTDWRAKTEALEKQNDSLRHGQKHKDRFISTLAHELRNPLSSLYYAIELLGSGADQQQIMARVVTTMQHEIAVMRRLIDDLLEATRLGHGKVQLDRHCWDVRQIIESAVAICQPKIDSRTQMLHVAMAKLPLVVKADEVRLRQVFVNLIQNAANFTRHGGTIWVKVSLEANEAVVKVEDNGVGISPEMLPHIFDLFTQAEFAGEQADAGLGIGLSVVKDITALHGGSVQVRSDGIGKGSEFTVRLPLADGEERPGSPAA